MCPIYLGSCKNRCHKFLQGKVSWMIPFSKNLWTSKFIDFFSFALNEGLLHLLRVGGKEWNRNWNPFKASKIDLSLVIVSHFLISCLTLPALQFSGVITLIEKSHSKLVYCSNCLSWLTLSCWSNVTCWTVSPLSLACWVRGIVGLRNDSWNLLCYFHQRFRMTDDCCS
jgi:predicted acyltransferase